MTALAAAPETAPGAPVLGKPGLPIWLMGMTMSSFGIFGGVWAISFPQLLAAQHMPEPTIATVSALSSLPLVFGFVLSPILDLWISRRAWASLMAVLCGACLFGALLCRQNVVALTLLMTLGWTAAALFQWVLGGWLGSLLPDRQRPALGAWMAVGNTGTGGIAVMAAVPLLRALPFTLGAAILGLAVAAPTLLFLFLAAPPADERLSHEGFRAFFRDLRALALQRRVLKLIALFAAPAAAFALTNNLGGLGAQFKASENFVAVVGGAGVLIAGVCGALIVPLITSRVAPIRVYILIGFLGALFTLALIVAPRLPATFAAGLIGENAFQAAAFSAANAISLKSLGRANPLAATQMALLVAASSTPINYMQIIDGHAYGLGGLTGSFLADAGVSLIACAALAAWLWRWRPESGDSPDPESFEGASHPR
jgi:PAT family beta-lactamase induction signal transducer AmpG